jgi:murein DD-endopeptidase MepM/ murein hydrolase activator NlpD
VALLAAVAVAGAGVLLLAPGCERSLGQGMSLVLTETHVDPDLLVLAEEEFEAELPVSMSLVLPTSNDAILWGRESEFYQRLDATIPGLRRHAWEGGRYGIVRNQARTPAGPIFTRLHQGVDIQPVYRDARGEPLDTVRAIDAGVVAYINNNANGSNYGRYVVVRHDWAGSDVYTLNAHLATVNVRRSQQLARGESIGRMGYTGRGINRERAHLHLEVAMMLNRHYNHFHSAFYRGRNPHGQFFGRNLMGVDPVALFLALEGNPFLTFAEFVRSQPVAYRLALPGNRPLDILDRYPWLGTMGVSNDDVASGGAWVIAFTREGVPTEIVRQERAVSAPEVVYVAEDVRRNYLSTAGVLTRTGNTYSLTRNGRALAALLATTPRDVPNWF